MQELRQAGFSLAVDDYGTGHASISYLQHFPFNYLKIDKLFVQAIGSNDIIESLNDAIIQMAKGLNLVTIAEGVETKDQANYLANNGVRLQQGWYYSKGLSIAELTALLKGEKYEELYFLWFTTINWFIPSRLYCPNDEKGSYWKCVTYDKANKAWTAQSSYRKVAINVAFAACKKESQLPATCKTSISNCEGFINGVSTRPMWRCTAIDITAQPWESNFYSNRDDAALAAQAYCKENSTLPATCYINMVTCANKNEGAHSDGLFSGTNW